METIKTEQAHANLWLQRAILRAAAYLEAAGGEDILEHYGFFEPHLAPLRAHFEQELSLPAMDRQWRRIIQDAEQALGDNTDFPLLRLRHSGLTGDHLFALMLVGLVEVDARFGTVYSVLYPFPEELRLTVGLLHELLRFGRAGDGVNGWDLARDLAQMGLLNIHEPDLPRAARPLTIPAPVWDALNGRTAGGAALLNYRPRSSSADINDLQGLLPQQLLMRLARLPGLAER